MRKWVMGAALLCWGLLAVNLVHADEMTFALSGTGLDALGTFYAAPQGPGQWLVGDASGTFNGANIVGIWPESNSGNIFNFNNLFYSPGAAVDWAGIVFKLDNGDLVNLCYDSGCAGTANTYTAIVWDAQSGLTYLNADSASFGEPVPEPTSMLLLGSGFVFLSRAARRAITL